MAETPSIANPSLAAQVIPIGLDGSRVDPAAAGEAASAAASVKGAGLKTLSDLDTRLTALESYTDGLEASLTTLAAGMPAVAATGSLSLVGTGADGEVVVIGGRTFEYDSGVAATGTITVAAGNAADTETVTIGDGTTTVVFEFDDGLGGGVTGDNTAVLIGVDAATTMDALHAAINASALTITSTQHQTVPGTTDRLDLAADAVGTAGNVAITEATANVTVTGMSGGLAAGTAITPVNVGVVIGADAAGTMANLVAAINATTACTVAATAATPADHTATLAAKNAGLAGNVTITTTDATLTVAGMSGGLDAVTLRTLAETNAAVLGAIAGGLPTKGVSAVGADAYAAVATSPGRVCSHMIVELDAGSGDAIVSLNGGTSDNIYVRAGTAKAFDGLAIPAESAIKGKNASAGVNYAHLRVEVW